MGYIAFGMFPGQVPLLINMLDALHVCSGIVGEVKLLSSSDMLCSPVKISEINRAANFPGNGMEACFPFFHRLSCSFGSNGQMNNLLRFHLTYYAENQCRRILSVNRQSSELAEQPAHRSPEKLLLDHAPCISSRSEE